MQRCEVLWTQTLISVPTIWSLGWCEEKISERNFSSVLRLDKTTVKEPGPGLVLGMLLSFVVMEKESEKQEKQGRQGDRET